jgi:rubrerythrin
MPANRSIRSLESALDLAVWLEKRGLDFYRQAAAATTDAEQQQLFLLLADEEQKHCAVYTDLYRLYRGKTADDVELLGEYGRFIELMVRELTTSLDVTKVDSREALLEMALRFEKDTLLYFVEIKNLFSGKAASLVEAVCREEKRHIRLLLECRELLCKRSPDDLHDKKKDD